MRKILIVLLGLAAGGVFFAAAFLAALGAKGKESIRTGIETAPIYNHFPDLPETSEIQWCSKSSGGIGLTTTTLYIFAFYDHDVCRELQEMGVKDESEEIELYFVPDEVAGQKWRGVENADFAFQTGIRNTQKMNTTVYVSEAGTVLYIEAIGD